MITEFKADERLKEKLHKNQQIVSGTHAGLRKAINLFKVFVFVFPALFLIYAYTISDEFVYLHDRYGTIGAKNGLFILTVTGIISVLTLFTLWILKTLYAGFMREHTKGRFAESLIYNNGILEYGYKNYMQSNLYDRVIVKIPVDKIDKIICNEKIKRLTITGLISSLYYDNYEKSMTRGEEKYLNESFVIYDYFAPSLLAFFKSIDVKIINEQESVQNG